MRKSITILTLFVLPFLFSCSSENEDPKLDISITGTQNISIDFGQEETMTIDIIFNNEANGSINLALADVPTGIEWSFSKSTGSESFDTNLELSTTDEAEDGNYQVKLIGEKSDGSTIEKVFTLTVVKNLSVSFSILHATSWTIDNPEYDAVILAELTLFNQNDELVNTFAPDENGKVMIYNLSEGDYYVQVESETLTFLAEVEEVDGKTVGFLVSGVFETQEEIDSSPQQPSAQVGDARYSDLNQDFIVNADDKTSKKRFTYDSSTDPEELEIYLVEKE